MRRYLFLLVLCLSLVSFAQKSFMRVASFAPIENDMEARLHYEMTPDEDPCILIKLVSIHKGFDIDVGGAILCKVDAVKKPAETWIWVTPNVRKMRIQHKLLGVLDFRIPIRIERKTVYEMVIETNKKITVMENDTPGFLVVNSTPSDADVYIDGKKAGKTPFEKPLEIGSYSIEIKKEGYETTTKTVKILPEETKEITEKLPSLFGIAEIKSEPSGAKIIIGGKDTGLTTPAKKELLAGNYQIELEKELYGTVKFDIDIKKQETNTVEKTLISNFGSIKIATTQGAKISIDRKFEGVSSVEKSLAPGKYYVVISKTGYFDIKKMITVTKNKTTTLDLPLKGKEGTLILRSKPTKAIVYIDGEQVGTTPLVKKIIEGNHRVRVQKEGYQTINTKYEISYQQKTNRRIVLEKSNTPEKENTTVDNVNTPDYKNRKIFSWGLNFGVGLNLTEREIKTPEDKKNTSVFTEWFTGESTSNPSKNNNNDEKIAYNGGIWASVKLGYVGLHAELNHTYIRSFNYRVNNYKWVFETSISKIDLPTMLTFGKNLQLGVGVNSQYIIDMTSIDRKYNIILNKKWMTGWVVDLGAYIKEGGISFRMYSMEWASKNIIGSVQLTVDFDLFFN